MTSREHIRKTLRAFILKNYLFTDDESALTDSDSFLEAKILDSMGVLEMIQYLGEAFAIAVEDTEMIPENLDSIDRLTEFVQRKTA